MNGLKVSVIYIYIYSLEKAAREKSQNEVIPRNDLEGVAELSYQ